MTTSSTDVAAARYMDGVRLGIAEAMREDERVVLMGIDVGNAGGIFGVTRDLADEFGEERVINVPISEMGFAGAAVGAATAGMRPIVEIMFMDFLGVCLDPIMNQAAKLRYMTGGALQVPIVFRMQTGAGRSAGAQHSQSLEGMLAHIPGLKVFLPATISDARALMLEAVRDDGPVVYVENRRLYGSKGRLEGDDLPPGRARVAREGRDVTVVTWGQMVRESLAAAEAASASLEVIDLRTLVPLDMEAVVQSVRRTGRLLVVHEAVRDFGPGAEIAARAAEECHEALVAPPRRLGTKPVPSPFSPVLEREVMPSREDVQRIADALAEGS
jgi:pyruvate/2-oxoglutarate/acetoin dehydrogenase E1 component